jgi:anti-anti-sigma factor
LSEVTILDVNTEERDGLARVALKGELDLSTVSLVRDALQGVGSPAVVVLDLSNLSFLDSTGLRLIVTSAEEVSQDGRRFVIVKGPDAVQRVFSITKLDDRLEIVDDASVV